MKAKWRGVPSFLPVRSATVDGSEPMVWVISPRLRLIPACVTTSKALKSHLPTRGQAGLMTHNTRDFNLIKDLVEIVPVP